MIKVNIKKDMTGIEKVRLSGHANYSEYGTDIVCAAVSSIVTTSVNGIVSIDKDAITATDNKEILEITVLKHNPVTDKLLINMVDLLKEIEKQYKKNISVRTEENEC